MDTATRVQTLNEAIFISHSANTVGKDINRTILPAAMSKIEGQTELFSLDMATGLEKGKPIKLRVKTDLVSHPVRTEQLVNTYIYIYIFCEVS